MTFSINKNIIWYELKERIDDDCRNQSSRLPISVFELKLPENNSYSRPEEDVFRNKTKFKPIHRHLNSQNGPFATERDSLEDNTLLLISEDAHKDHYADLLLRLELRLQTLSKKVEDMEEKAMGLCKYVAAATDADGDQLADRKKGNLNIHSVCLFSWPILLCLIVGKFFRNHKLFADTS